MQGEDETRNGKEAESPPCATTAIAATTLFGALNQFEPALDYVLKERWADFEVTEVDLHGELASLDTPSDPSLFEDKRGPDLGAAEGEEPQPQNTMAKKPKHEPLNRQAVLDAFTDLLSPDSLSRLAQFLDNPTQIVLTDTLLTDKQKRTEVHRLCKELLAPHAIASDTVDSKYVRLTCTRDKTLSYDRRTPQSSAGKQEQGAKQYLSFVMEKENVDTIEAVNVLSRRLHLGPKNFSYAGTKDKRAVTRQRVHVFGCNVKRLLGFNKIPGTRIKVGAVRRADSQLPLGALQGNVFKVVLRGVTPVPSVDELEARAAQVKLRGFLNYYGPQRFGVSKGIPTYEVGKLLLRGQWREAICMILDPRPDERDPVREARLQWSQGNLKDALATFPFFCTTERQLLVHLIKSPNDHLGAIGNVNREMRMLYLHSVQSLIWNEMAHEMMVVLPAAAPGKGLEQAPAGEAPSLFLYGHETDAHFGPSTEKGAILDAILSRHALQRGTLSRLRRPSPFGT